ncbi:MAG TPA: hypothetical protein VFI23_14750 [Rhizomicrobium sp.]|nr:hypothetical protein [Rhizomicrobium sp.]
MSKHKKAILVRGANLTNAAMVLHTVALARKYCADYRIPQPPLPADAASFAPCTLEMSEWKDDDGGRIGRLQFLRDDGSVIFDQEWRL